MLIRKGSVDRTIDVFIPNSASTAGAGLTGLVFNSAGLTCYYRRGATGTATALTLATQTVGGAHADGGFVEIDANMPGMYRLDLSDAIVASGVPFVHLMLKGATNMAPVPIRLQLVDFDPEDATALGLSRLDAAITTRSSHTAADVWTSGTRTLTSFGTLVADIWANGTRTLTGFSTALAVSVWDVLESAVATASSMGLKVKTNLDAAITSRHASGAAVASVTGNVGGNVVGSVGSVAAGGIAAASFAAGAVDAASLATDAGQEIADRVLARNVSGGSDAGRTVKQALHRLRNKVSIAAGTMTVTDTDDTTSSWTAAVTTAAGNPVDSVDPA